MTTPTNSDRLRERIVTIVEAKSREEVRDEFLDYLWILVDSWAEIEGDCHYRLGGLVHSILATIDGSAAALPAFKLVCDPHPGDRQYNIDNGNDWYPTGADITGNEMLHDLWYRRPKGADWDELVTGKSKP